MISDGMQLLGEQTNDLANGKDQEFSITEEEGTDVSRYALGTGGEESCLDDVPNFSPPKHTSTPINSQRGQNK